MDSSTAQRHNQEMSSQTLERMLACPKPQQDKKPRPADQQALNCPRCDSTNTKFCYYNNYSLSQPRYFCKSCRRYWTKGGTLRNVPVGGGCRKNKRSSPSISSSSSKKGQDHSTSIPVPNPSLTNSAYSSNYDLSLAISTLQKQNPGQVGLLDNHDLSIWGHPSMSEILGGSLGFLETAPNGFANLCYGGNMGVENGRLGFNGEISCEGAATVSTAVTTVKQEICNKEGESRGNPWGMAWQNPIGGDELFDSGRLNWLNGGLLNSPLM